jgi:ribosomal-protein-alanine N-acetyltransferase
MTIDPSLSGLAIPVLLTERLRLRAPQPGDIEPHADFCASPRSKGVGGPFSRAQAFMRLSAVGGHWLLRGYGRWVIADRNTDAPLGLVGPYFPDGWPEPEIAWSLFAGAEGKGIAFEAATAARRWVYDTLGWTTAVSCVSPDNDRSNALARRMGCVQEDVYHHPDGFDLLVWRHPGPEALAA